MPAGRRPDEGEVARRAGRLADVIDCRTDLLGQPVHAVTARNSWQAGIHGTVAAIRDDESGDGVRRGGDGYREREQEGRRAPDHWTAPRKGLLE